MSRMSNICLLALFLFPCPPANSQTAQQRFKDSRVEMPPGYLDTAPKGMPELLISQPRQVTQDSLQLIVERMKLLEQQMDLMEMRLKKIEDRKK